MRSWLEQIFIFPIEHPLASDKLFSISVLLFYPKGLYFVSLNAKKEMTDIYLMLKISNQLRQESIILKRVTHGGTRIHLPSNRLLAVFL